MSLPTLPTPTLARYAPDQYDQGASLFIRLCWYVVNAFVFSSWLFPCTRLKAALLRLFGAKVGRGAVIKPRVNIKHPWRLVIGDYVWVGEGVWIDNLVKVEIGSNVCISQGALLLTGSHDYSDMAFRLVLGEIYVEDGVWLAANAVVCPGIRCRRNSVITVGSVLRKDAEVAGVYAGNPATLVRHRIIQN